MDNPSNTFLEFQKFRKFRNLEFVVARYAESIEWIIPLMLEYPGAQCIVYNKGPRDICDTTFHKDMFRVVELQNVGRESQTYIEHIIRGYERSNPISKFPSETTGDKSDKITVFLQGNPDDHCPMSLLKKSLDLAIDKITSKKSVFENIGTRSIEIKDSIPRYHMSIKNDLQQTSKDLLGAELPRNFYFGAGALIAVSEKAIRRRPLEFYLKANAMLNKHVNPVRGFCFERLWSLIFV